MATFLQLCQRVHRYARIGEDAPGTAPLTVAGQQGVLAEIVSWVQDAYEDIQLDQDDWAFRKAPITVQVAAGQRNADIAGALADFDAVRPYTADACSRYILGAPADAGAEARQPVYFVAWADWAGGHDALSLASGRPVRYTVDAAGLLRLYPTPDVAFNLTLDYQRAVQVMAADADVPIVPLQHQAAIVWRALMYYADTRDNTDALYKKWERRRRQAMRRLYRDQLPEVTL